MVQTNATFKRDWDRDGYLIIQNAQTLERYLELKNIKENTPLKELGIFFAYNKKQFLEGYNNLVAEGRIKDGDKVVRGTGGVFGIKGAFLKLTQFYETQDEIIRAECSPQEVYWYEYNNYESCISYDGDKDAIRVIIDIFGKETARAIKRIRDFYNIDDID